MKEHYIKSLQLIKALFLLTFLKNNSIFSRYSNKNQYNFLYRKNANNRKHRQLKVLLKYEKIARE